MKPNTSSYDFPFRTKFGTVAKKEEGIKNKNEHIKYTTNEYNNELPDIFRLDSMTPSSNVYKFKGTKATYEELPASENEVGDVWNVTGNNGMNYVWTGTEWDALGATYEIEALSNSEIDNIMV